MNCSTLNFDPTNRDLLKNSMKTLKYILFPLIFLFILEGIEGQKILQDVVGDVGQLLPLNRTLSTVNSTLNGIKKLLPVKRETRMDYQIEEGNSYLEEMITKKPQNGNKKRTKPPKRKGKKQPPQDDDEDNNEEISVEIDDGSESDGIVPDKPIKGSKKPQKAKKEENGKTFFQETFSERGWDSAWVYSKMEYDNDKEKKKYEKFYRIRSRRGKKGFDYGLVTSNKGSEEYAISASFQPLNSNDGPLVVQFAVQYQTVPHCEYVNLRLFDCKFKPEEFTSQSPYLIQMGPNICGTAKHLGVILADPVKGERHVIADKLPAVTSTELHMYSLIIQQDGNYQILINSKSVQNGSLTTAFPNYQGFPSVCAVGLNIWHSILDKFFNGQIIIDDILITSDVKYAEKRRTEILEIVIPDVATNSTKKEK